MDYEKMYKEAVGKIQELLEEKKKKEMTNCLFEGELNEIFSELRESEDERIRKELIEQVVYIIPNDDEVDSEGNILPTYQKRIDKYIAWLENQSKQKPLYIRFGDVPSNETSKIYRGEIEVGNENGVSVYPAFEVNGDIVLGLTLPITKTTLYTQQHLLEYDNRPCYLVSGDYVGKGTDGEPLIRNISIIKRLDNYRIKDFEKQGEQKPVPKFKVGDWIIHETSNFIYKVLSRGNDGYMVANVHNDKFTISLENEERYHLWTIKDAKDGDVLCTYECGKPKIVFILKGAPEKPYVLGYHCFYNIMYPHFVFHSEKGCLAPNEEDVKPATKEQRNLLFQEMKEAGYVWDAEKKELKEIEQESTWNDKTKDLNKVEEYILSLVPNRPLDAVKTDAKNIRFLVREEQKPAEWRITDEDMFRSAVWHIKNSISNGKPDTITKSDILDWFITLKERVQPRQEWSEEDKMHLDEAIHLASNTGHIETANWLKSLKDRYNWKPSDTQMVALDGICSYIRNKADWEISQDMVYDLYKLSEQLKKL